MQNGDTFQNDYIVSDLCRDFLGIPFSAGGFGAKAPGNSKGYNCDLWKFFFSV